MSGLLTLGVVLSAVDSLSPVLGTATGNLNKLENRISSVSANITKLGTASLALGTAITAPLKGALDDYQNLAVAQGEIASLGIDDSGIKSITKSAREFSNEFAGTTAPAFVKASYDIKSGISTLSDTAVGEFTKTAALTATATKSSVGEMTSLFATGYGIYRKQFEDFGASTVDGWGELSDEEKDIKFGEYFSAGIAGSVQAFKTDGAQMSASMSALGATATNAGVSFAEQLSILGTLQQTMSGSEAATKYKSFLNAAVGAGDKLGVTFTDANDKLLSTPEILETLREKYGDTLDAMEKDEIKKAFGSDEAVAMIDILYSKTDTLKGGMEDLNKTTANGTEITNKMAKAMNKGKEFDLLGQQMNNVSTLIGGAFAPLALSLAETIGGVVNSVSSWMQENEELSSTIFTGVAIIGGLLTVVGSVGVAVGAAGMAMPFLAGGIGLVSSSFTMLGTVMGVVGKIFLMNPIGLAATAIAGAAYLIYSNWEPIGGFFSGLWNGVKSIFSSAINIVKNYLGWTPLGMILNNWTPISGFFSGLWDGVTSIFSRAWSGIKSSFFGVVDFIKSPFVAFFDWMATKFEWVTDTVGFVVDKVSGIGKGISDTVGGIGDSIGDGLKSASDWFKFGDDTKVEAPIDAKSMGLSMEQTALTPSVLEATRLQRELGSQEAYDAYVSTKVEAPIDAKSMGLSMEQTTLTPSVLEATKLKQELGSQEAYDAYVSTKGTNRSIEKTQQEVLNSNVSSTNEYMYTNNQANRSESRVIHNEPTYHITVTNPNSDVDVVRAMKEYERRQKNKSYEDD